MRKLNGKRWQQSITVDFKNADDSALARLLVKPLKTAFKTAGCKGRCVMANELSNVTINGQEFELYTTFFSLDTMTWTKEPTRSLDGSMPDINDIDRFPVPRLWIDFKYISIDDYRRLLSAVNAPEFEVTYYNLETDSMVTHNMYIHPLDRYKNT